MDRIVLGSGMVYIKEFTGSIPEDTEIEKEEKIGKLYDKFYTTVGNGTAVASAKAFAEEFAPKMKADGVDAVILTSK